MCGFAGIYSQKTADVDPRVLRKMRWIQEHRGPDALGYCLFSFARDTSLTTHSEMTQPPEGLWDGGVAFNRLSIQDLSPEAHQPMSTPDGRVHIAFNGEIYNAGDYRAELEAEGYSFRTNSDTEVILYLYDRFGHEEMLNRINGMFAICVVDLNRQVVLLVRDRVGIKPLYLFQSNGLVLFSSELKSFYAHPSFSPELEEDYMDELLAFRYCAFNRTLLKGVQQLEPGTWAALSSGGLVSHRYWEIPWEKDDANLSINDAVDQFEASLEESVRRRLLSDVPIGCQLSGGVDSSIINVFASRHAGGNLGAYSVVMDDPRFSEKPWIDTAVERANVVSHQFNLDGEFFFKHLNRATWHLDQPINHPNSIGIYFLAQESRRSVTVLLSGEGADELLGGYPRHALIPYGAGLGPLRPILGALPRVGRKFRRAFGEDRDIDRAIIRATAFNSVEDLQTIYPRFSLDRAIASRETVLHGIKGDILTRFLNYEMLTYMVELLVRQDKMTMAHSLENRVPFLDHTLVEMVRRKLPSRFLVRPAGGPVRFREKSTKIVLKKVAARYFDADFVYRRKAGFAIPLGEFFEDPMMKERMEDEILPSLSQRGMFDAASLGRIWGRFPSVTSREIELLWVAVSTEIWAKMFLSSGAMPDRAP